MTVSIERFLRDVRVCLDQNNRSDALIVEDDPDTLELDEMIRSKLVDAVREVHMIAPAQMLDKGTLRSFAGPVHWTDKECGYVFLPDDFMRAVEFRMSDWVRSVYDFEAEGGAYHRLMSSDVKALRGTRRFPRACVCTYGGRMVMEFASCASEEAFVETANYVAEPQVSGGVIDVSSACYRPAVYVAAALVVEGLGDLEKAATLWNRGAGQIGTRAQSARHSGDGTFRGASLGPAPEVPDTVKTI